MDRLRQALALDVVLEVIKKRPVTQARATELAQHGTANFLLSDGEYVYAHRSTKLYYVERQCPGRRETLAGPALRVALSPPDADLQHGSLIATEPLTTHEVWRDLPAGEVVVFHRGQRII